MKYFIYLQYDGTNYHGWQTQPDAVTVQDVIEQKLSMLLRRQIFIVGAGRTDAGVHASQMVASLPESMLREAPQRGQLSGISGIYIIPHHNIRNYNYYRLKINVFQAINIPNMLFVYCVFPQYRRRLFVKKAHTLSGICAFGINSVFLQLCIRRPGGNRGSRPCCRG